MNLEPLDEVVATLDTALARIPLGPHIESNPFVSNLQ